MEYCKNRHIVAVGLSQSEKPVTLVSDSVDNCNCRIDGLLQFSSTSNNTGEPETSQI